MYGTYSWKEFFLAVAQFIAIIIGSLAALITFFSIGVYFVPKQTDKVIETSQHIVKITNINPPKHFYVDIIDLTTNTTHTNLYVSKHCNKYREISLNVPFEVTMKRIQRFEDDVFKYEYVKYDFSHLCK